MKHLCGVPGCTNKSEWFRTHTVISDTIIEDNEFLDRFIKKGVCDAHIREFNSIYQYGVLFPAGVVEISSESHVTCAFNDCTEEPKWACPAVSLFDLHIVYIKESPIPSG